MFATSTPFELVRGNHETRGKMARIYPKLFPKKNGKIYGSYRIGDIMIVMIDCGEDKPDTIPHMPDYWISTIIAANRQHG